MWKRDEAKTRTPVARSLVEELRPCVWTLMAFNVWPLYTDQEGRVQLRARRRVFLYALTLYIVLASIAANALVYWWKAIKAFSGIFSVQSFLAFFIIYGHMVMAIPFVYWTNCQHIARAFNAWPPFQARFSLVTGSPLRLRLRRRATALAILSPLFGVTVAGWAHPGYIPWNQVPVYEYGSMYLALIPGVWQLVVDALCEASDQLHAQLRQSLEALEPLEPLESLESPEALEPGLPRRILRTRRTRRRRLRELCGLWVRLDDMLQLWSRAWSYAHLHVILSCVGILLISVFGLMLPLLRRQGFQVRLVGLVLALFYQTYNVSYLCSTGDQANREVRSKFIKTLLFAKFEAAEAEAYGEVFKFLKTLKIHEAQVPIAGYKTLDRSLAIGVGSLLITYIVVLLQFAYAKGAK